jgi:Flp pilus assembly protein TadB
MTQSQPERPKPAAGRLVAAIFAVCLIAVVVWRFIWPWTGAAINVVFIAIAIIGALLAAAYSFKR